MHALASVRKKSSSAVDVTFVCLFTFLQACVPFYSGAPQAATASAGFLMIGCTVASTTWRHRALARLSGGDAAKQNYTERGYVVLKLITVMLVCQGLWILAIEGGEWVKYDCLAVLGGAFSGVS
jgi:hypothetical protein